MQGGAGRGGGAGPGGAAADGGAGLAGRGGAGALGPPRQTAAMEQAPPDPERRLQPAPLEPLGHPDAGLEAVVGEEVEGARDEGSGDGTVRRRVGGGRGACVGA